MPELPEVEGLVRSLKPIVTGKTILLVDVSETIITSKANGKEAILKGLDVEYFCKVLQHMTIESIERRSKYIYFHLVKNQLPYLLVSHLGMSGAWFYVRGLHEIVEDKFKRHTHVILHLVGGDMLVYADIRRFGELRFLKNEEDYPPLLLMAPEPFDQNALDHYLAMSSLPKYENKAIKEFIMDGHVVSGCGNIYATEALFRMRIHPGRKVKRISKERKIQLFNEIVIVLLDSIEQGGSSISDYRKINGESGNMQNRLQMYGKKKCPICNKRTLQQTIGGRTSTYCGTCQR
ncbi:bifunctional DNA-formamidopyrimidine glycosylase/DNA-(apurinic or apyrimidinic site) lyase [Psychrobacillus glaciei]|uniref:Bifunctional DNA-formamidopyrimidine glycosylase/DNA-(Apurinic or apyrimidinic site) lyase n=1 Tax=Psychrobacillus glaciei TaxID=2283160 RepID=A0A5J6SP27_9BACI|nr:bifunctional DNA-formamidopyrimidine glycosylase/DNA-(apurinic or apyrimidinic site) lyase [Psychrobacillus glaciei]QFF99675.1 bifunctional DNA-formamidopyrimidine glycosylase/DNA-(apurinic or apyrimidinic site) lyase [Psychrobacillus glaciei]